MQTEQHAEDKQDLKQEETQRIQKEQTITKEKLFFSSRCKWITFSFTLIAITTVATFLAIYLTKSKINLAPTLRKNQRDNFQQKDEICVISTSQEFNNCTEIHLNTTRVTTDVNQQNATSLLILQGLKISLNQYNSNGTVYSTDILEQNMKIEQQLQRLLRRLESSNNETNNNNICEGIPENECGDVNELPLLTVITDQQTGEVQQIGVPSKMSDLFLQPLVSNIIHNSPNVEEPSNNNINDGRRILLEKQISFLSKNNQKVSWVGGTIINKKITKQDLVGNSQGEGVDYFESFEQSQETSLDDYNFLVSSHISTKSLLDNQIKSLDQDKNIQSEKSQTEISGDSNLITTETSQDSDLTQALEKIQEYQTINYYSIQEIQDKVFVQQQIENVKQDIQNDLEKSNGTRLLQEVNGDAVIFDTNYIYQSGPCQIDGFNFSTSQKIKEVEIMNQKISLKVDLSGKRTKKTTEGNQNYCVSLNNNCVINLNQGTINMENRNTIEIQNRNNNLLFSIKIKIFGYGIDVVGQIQHIYNFQVLHLNSTTERGVRSKFSLELVLSSYGEINIADIIAIRSGTLGTIFKGDLNRLLKFKRRNVSKEEEIIISQVSPDIQTQIAMKEIASQDYTKYFVQEDYILELLKFETYAQVKTPELSWKKKCWKIWRKKICIDIPVISMSDWKDAFRKNYQLAKYQDKIVFYTFKSECYDAN